MRATDTPILIAGGGLGGLTTALALGRKGRPVQVLEETAEVGAIGYGIQLGPNVFPMFTALGITDAVLDICLFPNAALMLDALTGEEIARVPTGRAFRDRFQHPYVVLHRGDLHNVLIDACRRLPAIEIVPSTRIAGFNDLGDHVVVMSEDGRRFEGAALIGADGLRSRVRAELLGNGEPRPIGYVAHRTIVPITSVPDDVRRTEVVLWAGPGFHIVHYPLRHGELFNIVAVFRTATHGEKNDARGYRIELKRSFESAHPTMKTMLAMMDLERRWPIADRDPSRRWSEGRVVLLGDAAHPALQSLAQGACMAIEDGVCLAELIELSQGEFERAFRAFQAERRVRTARVQLESRYLWEVYHAEDIARDVRRETFAERTEADMFRCLAWLYDGFKLPAEPRWTP